MQFAAVVVDQPLFVLGERSIEIDRSKKMLACTGEIIHFLFNPHGLPFQVTSQTTEGWIGDEDGSSLYRVTVQIEIEDFFHKNKLKYRFAGFRCQEREFRPSYNRTEL